MTSSATRLAEKVTTSNAKAAATPSGNQAAGEERAGDRHRLAAQPVDGDGGRQALARHQARDGRGSRAGRRRRRLRPRRRPPRRAPRPADSAGRRGAPGTGSSTASRSCVTISRRRRSTASAIAPPPSEKIEDRHELDEGQQSDRERVVGQVPQLERQGDDGDLATEAVDDLAEPDHPEVAVAPDRLEVDQEAAQPGATVGVRRHGGRIGEVDLRLGRPVSRSPGPLQSVVEQGDRDADEPAEQAQQRRPFEQRHGPDVRGRSTMRPSGPPDRRSSRRR